MEENNNFWQTTKGKAAIKLGLWMIFIIVLIVIALFSQNDANNNVLNDNDETNEPTPSTPVYDFTNYTDMQENLLANNYEYIYTITNSETKYIYSGMKSNGKEMGFREDVNGVIKYYADEIGTYQVNLDNAVLIDTLYQNIDASYLDINMLFTNLDEYLYSVDKNEDLRTITYDKEGYQVSVLTDTTNILGITILVEDTTYQLEFSKIGECEEIDFTI